MTTHIKNKIETILFNGGFVEKELKKFIDVLEDIRGVESINREFKAAFNDIEKRKGQILESIKTKTFSYINSTEKYNYEKGQLH